MGFFVWEENPLLLQEANAIRDIACILLRKTKGGLFKWKINFNFTTH